MCLKLFIFRDFYFLILELNVGPHHKYSSKWVIEYKNQKNLELINCKKKKKSASQYQKLRINKKKNGQFTFST